MSWSGFWRFNHMRPTRLMGGGLPSPSWTPNTAFEQMLFLAMPWSSGTGSEKLLSESRDPLLLSEDKNVYKKQSLLSVLSSTSQSLSISKICPHLVVFSSSLLLLPSPLVLAASPPDPKGRCSVWNWAQRMWTLDRFHGDYPRKW